MYIKKSFQFTANCLNHKSHMPNKTRHLGNGEGVGETLFDFAMTRKSGVKFNHKEPVVESSDLARAE
jgi:hypothetical protein